MNEPPAATAAWVDLVSGDTSTSIFAAKGVGEAAVSRLGARFPRLTVGERPIARSEVIVLDARSARTELGRFTSALAPAGRLVILADNPRSPLRAIDRAAGRRGGPSAGSLGSLRRRITAAGLDSVVVFALLRDSASPTAAFRLDLPRIADTVLAATATGTVGGRRVAIEMLRQAARRERAAGLVPAWLVVASREPMATTSSTPTGRIAVAENEQGALLLGPGPDAVEKWYIDPARLETVAAARQELEAAGIDVGGRLIGRPAPMCLRTSWVPGADLDPFRMSAEELARWLERAALRLGEIQAGTLDDSGMVLVHGDYWLGCVVADGDRISGVIDWADAHRGDPAVDLTSLLAVLGSRVDLSADARRAMVDRVGAAHAAGGGPAEARRHLSSALADALVE